MEHVDGEFSKMKGILGTHWGRNSKSKRRHKIGRGTKEGIFDEASIECYDCHKIGHFQWECPNKRVEKKNFDDNDDDEGIVDGLHREQAS